MHHIRAVIETNSPLTQDVYLLRLTAPEVAAAVRPGQFVQVSIPGSFLGRPFSVAGCLNSSLEIIYRVVGSGTGKLATLKAGHELKVLGPLGRGFNPPQGKQIVLLGGGIGTAPLLMLARGLSKCSLVMGALDSSQLWLTQLAMPDSVLIQYATDDGSRGFHGNLVQAVSPWLTEEHWVGACGPVSMLRTLKQLMAEKNIDGQFALEEHMACGMGVCMGCACHTQGGPALVCKHGPVFAAREVLQ